MTQIEETTPEPAEVYVDYDRCKVHKCHFINMPRNVGQLYDGPRMKCPWKDCSETPAGL